MKRTIETYSGKLKDGKPELLYSEEVETPDPEPTPEQKEIAELKQRLTAAEAKLSALKPSPLP